MNEKVKQITKDAIFIALLTVIIVLMKYFLMFLESMVLLVLCIFIGIGYHKKSFVRTFMVCLSIFLLSFLYFDIQSILVFILPGLFLALISHTLLKLVKNVPYYLLTIIIYFIVHSIVEMVYAKLILNMGFNEYLLSGMDFPSSWIESIGRIGLLSFFFGYNLIMAILESFIMRKGVFVYELKINKNSKNHK